MSLTETLIAALVMVIGLLGLAQLLGTAIQMHQLTRNTEEATRLATVKLEQLAKLTFATDPAVQVSPAVPDPLTTNVANYFDTPSAVYSRRWRVEAGPTATTRLVTVRVAPITGDRRLAKPVDLTSIIREW